jgi:GNAT superfamily N-acetyltransferase
MWPRLHKGGKLWEESKGAKNRASLQRLVKGSNVHAVLAFAGEEPVGWCCFGPFADFPRLQTVRALKGDRPPGTWCVICFYIPARWRGHGVATALLNAATERAFALGADRIEGYPQKPSTAHPAPAAFVWMGVPELFKKVGYKKLPRRNATRPIFVRTK